ncbi:MAG: hypothetical protein GY851_12310, partial [bacterium]|nr:hypothetical protein [bacterium]
LQTTGALHLIGSAAAGQNAWTVESTAFESNTAPSTAGALFVDGAHPVSLESVRMLNNSVVAMAGGLYAQDATVHARGCVFSGNRAGVAQLATLRNTRMIITGSEVALTDESTGVMLLAGAAIDAGAGVSCPLGAPLVNSSAGLACVQCSDDMYSVSPQAECRTCGVHARCTGGDRVLTQNGMQGILYSTNDVVALMCPEVIRIVPLLV